MRFSALLRKELRESLPWMLLAAIIFLAIGGFFLREAHLYGMYDWSERYFSSRPFAETYGLQYHRFLDSILHKDMAIPDSPLGRQKNYLLGEANRSNNYISYFTRCGLERFL